DGNCPEGYSTSANCSPCFYCVTEFWYCSAPCGTTCTYPVVNAICYGCGPQYAYADSQEAACQAATTRDPNPCNGRWLVNPAYSCGYCADRGRTGCNCFFNHCGGSCP